MCDNRHWRLSGALKTRFALFTLLAIAAALGPAASLPLSAAGPGGSVTDSISVHIGYFGWEEDQYVEKATYTWQELDGLFGGTLNTHEQVYSYYSGSRSYLVAARGFYIRDLLEYAAIDFPSIARIDFFTRDQTVGAYRSFTKESLFDLPRYFFPNLAVDASSGELYPYNGGDLYDGAVQVEPMLALEDYTEWDSVGSLFASSYDRNMFATFSRFHLFFGQLTPEETSTSSAAKYVYKLLITFSGTPVLSTEETNIALKVGSDFRLTVNVAAEDTLLDAYVAENLIWSSNNTTVIDVDNFGNLTVKEEGEAVVTATFGESSVSATVRVSDEGAAVSEGGAGAATAPGERQAEGEGDPPVEAATEDPADSAGEPAPAEPDAPPEAAPAAPVEPPEAAPAAEEEASAPQDAENPQDARPAEDNQDVQFAENERGVYILSSEFMERQEFADWVNSILDHRQIDNSGQGGLNNARREAMDADAAQLILLARREKTFFAAVFGILACFFAAGFGCGIISFKRKL